MFLLRQMFAVWCVFSMWSLAACDSETPNDATTGKSRGAQQELASGAARVRGGGVRMDVTVGRSFTVTPIDSNR